MRYNTHFPMANEFLNLIEKVNNGITPDSQNILFYFGKKCSDNQGNLVSKNVLSPDPFHFLYFLFQFLHIETNMSNQYDTSLFNQPLELMRNDNYIYMQFLMFIIKTQNSIISNEFFNTVRYTYECPMCGKYFFYGLQNIYRMNIDSIRYFRDEANPMKKGSNLDLSELFTCFSGGCYNKCRNCGNNKCPRYTRICFPAKTIIISLERKIHPFKNDIDFWFNFDMEPFISTTRRQGMNLNTIYELKAIISYVNFGNDGKYFADCKINNGNLNNTWIRYIDSNYSLVQPNEIFTYEPQILIYEVSNKTVNQVNGQNMMSTSFNNNNNFTNVNPMNNNFNIMNQIYANNIPNNNMNINMNNNNFMMNTQNLFENTNVNKNFSPVQPSSFQNMQLVHSNNNINPKTFSNNLINVQQQPIDNNSFMDQINQFNNNNLPNMKISLNQSSFPKEVSVEEAQNQNQNMMKFFECDYLSGDLMKN